MTDKSPASARGNPPNRDQLAEALGKRLALWNEVREAVVDFGADWKWAYSEATNAWTYRSYLPGDRFFASLTVIEGGFEVSLNLRPEEWDGIVASSPAEQTQIAALRSAIQAQGDEMAWLHLPIRERGDLPLLVKLLVARARRVQKPRMKPAKKR